MNNHQRFSRPRTSPCACRAPPSIHPNGLSTVGLVRSQCCLCAQVRILLIATGLPGPVFLLVWAYLADGLVARPGLPLAILLTNPSGPKYSVMEQHGRSRWGGLLRCETLFDCLAPAPPPKICKSVSSRLWTAGHQEISPRLPGGREGPMRKPPIGRASHARISEFLSPLNVVRQL